MTINKYQCFPNLYQDSVSLMQLSAALSKLEGIQQASVVMGTEANLQRIADQFGNNITAKPNDLVVAVIGAEQACDQAIDYAIQQLTNTKKTTSTENSLHSTITSLALAVEQDPELNLALISVPGSYAAAEAEKALRLGLNVMLFSDNVSLAEEKYIKTLAQKLGLLVMGPDCGTAIINGIPLGFANVVRSGHIGVIAASGTGLQEVTTRIHHLGQGISQALGTGGHDLHQEIGGISMCYAMQSLASDPNTKIIVLISKPPAPQVMQNILIQAQQLDKPVVIHFLGYSTQTVSSNKNIYFAQTLAHTAEIAVALFSQQGIPNEQRPNAKTLIPPIQDRNRCYIRGVFAGGTFCYEAQCILNQYQITPYSNTPIQPEYQLDDLWQSQQHSILDLGDDLFTQGRPHPMIDPSLRNQRIEQEAQDPETAIILFDLVLGYGATQDPLQHLSNIIKKYRKNGPLFIAHVCGTEQDPQNRQVICQQLRQLGVYIAENNAQACHLAAQLIQH